ncbi:MAG: FtsX-like permease family protein [Rhodopirellula sp.]|nr:FtsX-like permease family protein [Rhodopirellula sp.]
MWWWIVAVNQMRERKGRSLLTLSSVAIAVAAVLSVMVAAVTTRSGWQQLYETVGGRAALEVLAETGESFSSEVLEALSSTPGVKTAVPAIQRPTIVYANDRRVQSLALGIDPQRDSLVRDYVFREGGPLVAEGQILLEAGFARSLGVALGEEIKILTRRGMQRFTVVGLLEPRGAAAFTGGGIVFLLLEEAQYLFRLEGHINTAYLLLEDGADEEDVRSKLAQRLPQGLVARSPAARSEVGKETLWTLERGLNLSSAMSLVAAAFIILNGFFMNLTERWRQLATLRALGSTRRQVLGLVLGEGLLVGIAGSVLGVLLGFGGAALLTAAMARLMQMSLPPVRISWVPVVSALLMGIGISLLAAAIPAWFASKISPVDGMRGRTQRDGEVSPWPGRIGMLVLSFATGLGISVSSGWLPVEVAGWTTGIALVGIVCLLPALTGPLLVRLAPVMEKLLGLEAWLASQQVRHRSMRTSLTAAVLFVVMVMSVAIGNAVLDNIDDVKQWYRRTIVGDFFIRAMMPDMATGEAADMPEELGDEIRAVAGVTTAEEVRFIRAEVDEVAVIVVARSFNPEGPLGLDLVEGEPEPTRRNLLAGEAVVATVLAKRAGLHLGDTITLSTPEGERQVKIAGTTNEYTVGGLVVYLDFHQAQKLLGVSGVDAFLVSVEPGTQAAVEPRLMRLCEKHGLLLQSFQELTRLVDGMISGVVGGLWVLMALGFIIAAFGMANTLTMNVLEQTKELALLRVVSMTRRQLRKFIVSQALAIAVVGLVPGVVVGVVLALAVNLVTSPLSGHPVEFVFRPQVLLGSLGAGFAIVLAAAYFPARRAVRLRLVEALSYE